MRHSIELVRTEALLANAWSRGLVVVALLGAFAGGLIFGRLSHSGSPSGATSESVTAARPGPWGEVEYIPISIECPEELLPVRALETKVTHWIFKGYTAEQWFRLLNDLQITGDLREQLRAPEVLHITETGLDVTPTPQIVFELPPRARTALYRILAGFPENGSSLVFVLARTLDERFAASGVSETTVELFKKLTCEYGRYRVFSDPAGFLSQIPTYEERVRFFKALTRQSTLLASLRVGPGSDVAALDRYWSKASWAKDVRPMLESVGRVPGGGRIALINLLPPVPSALLYTFPVSMNSTHGREVRRDCHWSAFNFFRDPPDDRLGEPACVAAALRDDYYPIATDPRYGDLVLFFTPEGSFIHSAVFLADNIVYTKNGDTSLHPWMLSTIPDLLDQYSFQVPPDKALDVRYYRNKSY